jgi:hypothetical protein
MERQFDIRVIDRFLKDLTIDLKERGPSRFGFAHTLANRL